MSKITKSARGEDCLIRLEKICNENPETTVFCHLPGGGMGAKKIDIHGAYGCSSCHDEVDRRTKNISYELAQLYFREGVERTQDKLIEKGLIQIK